jgi:hypothetical protein
MSASNMNISSKTIIDSPSLIMSVYIPRVFSNIHPNVISQTFEGQKIGVVDHIQMIQRPKKKGQSPAYMAFVYFKEWFTNQSALHLAERIVNPEKQARVVYDDPYYWIVLPNTTKGVLKYLPPPNNYHKQVSASSISQSSTSNDTYDTEKVDTLYLMIQDLQERVKHIEEYLCLLHKYTSLTQLPSSPVAHPDNTYAYNYNVDSDAGDDYTYTYSDSDDEVDTTSSSIQKDALAQAQSSPKMVRVDSLGLVYNETPEDDSKFWCDP